MKLKSQTLLIAVSLVLFASRLAVAANVTVVKNEWGEQVIEISGTVQKGDAIKVKQLSAQLILSQSQYAPKALHFHINSGGGDIDEAIQIGRFFREILASVDSYGTIIIAPGSEDERLLIKPDEPWRNRDYRVVPAGAQLTDEHVVKNYSAGILMFYGAVRRSHRDNSDQRLGFYRKQSIPVMGVHRPYYDRETFAKLSPAQAAEAYKRLEEVVRSYLVEMGAPQALLDRMFTSSSDRIDLVPADEFRTFYKRQESFLEEWLIAKCGTSGNYSTVLDRQEQEDFRKMEMWQIKARMKGGQEIGSLYPDPNFPDAYVKDLYTKIRSHNRRVDACRETAVSTHQRNWATSVRQAIN